MPAASIYYKNKDYFIKKAIEWNKLNPDARKATCSKYAKENREKLQQYQDNYRKEHPEKYLFSLAKRRAKRKNIEFNIVIEDIVIPALCPLLDIPINSYSETNDFRPSIDRIDSTKGYIKGNVWVVSWKANRLKNSTSLGELITMVVNLDKRMSQ